MRNFKKMETDELYALWNAYERTDFGSHNPLNTSMIHSKIPMRLTPVEIIKLVDEIFIRLLRKEGLIEESKIDES